MPTQLELVKDLSTDSGNWSKKHQWFSLGQLVDASNKKQESNDADTAQSIAIYFNNIQRLHWLLHEQPFNKNKILNDLNVPVSTEGMQATPQPFPKKEHPQAVVESTQLIAIAAVEENDAVQTIAVKENSNELVDDVVVHRFENTTTIKELPEVDDDEDIIIESVEDTPELVAENQPLAEVEINNDSSTAEAQEPINNFDERLPENKADNAENDVSVFSEVSNIEKEAVIENKDETANADLSSENIKRSLDDSDKAMELSFEPYHTIDYFASQGIKVDAKADDRLGKQLKSFTSWLKSMKRLPTTEDIPAGMPTVQIQDKSLEDIDVITEAMAAVLVKQGKKEQAIEIFKQLSLLHPEKSRYFAAQIEQIKN
jgi:hypothetical protein